MKNLIIENWCEQDIPRELQKEMQTKFIENREIWTQFQSSYHPKNREATIERFKALQTGDNIVCQTVFEDFQQLEIMAMILMRDDIQPGLNFYIYIHGILDEQIQEYLDKYESDCTPLTDEYNDSPKLRREFKLKMDRLVKQTLEKHNIINATKYDDLTARMMADQFKFNFKNDDTK